MPPSFEFAGETKGEEHNTSYKYEYIYILKKKLGPLNPIRGMTCQTSPLTKNDPITNRAQVTCPNPVFRDIQNLYCAMYNAWVLEKRLAPPPLKENKHKVYSGGVGVVKSVNWPHEIPNCYLFYKLDTFHVLRWNPDIFKYPCFHIFLLEFGGTSDNHKNQNSRTLC